MMSIVKEMNNHYIIAITIHMDNIIVITDMNVFEYFVMQVGPSYQEHPLCTHNQVYWL